MLIILYSSCMIIVKIIYNTASVFKFKHAVQVVRSTRQSRLMYIKRYHSTSSRKLPWFHFPNIWNQWLDFAKDMPSQNVLKLHEILVHLLYVLPKWRALTGIVPKYISMIAMILTDLIITSSIYNKVLNLVIIYIFTINT